MPAGRPSSYSEELAERICERIADGESLRKICEDADMPNRGTVRRWEDDHPDFAAKYARAREHQADAHFDRQMSVVDRVDAGELDPTAGRVVLQGLQWTASKLNRKRYGDAVAVDHGDIGKLTDEQLDARIAKLAGEAGVGLSAIRKGEAEAP